jgi:uncharacterized protein (DUF2147 family)
MKKVYFGIIALLMLYVSPASAKDPAQNASSPVGYWETISDVTHKPRSVVQISEKDGLLYGKLVKNLDPNETLDKVCDKCPDEFHNQPLKGMQFLWGLKENKNGWSGGKILDPDTGNIYRSKIALTEDGQQLKVRGYMGISLLGRTQTWNRTAKP